MGECSVALFHEKELLMMIDRMKKTCLPFGKVLRIVKVSASCTLELRAITRART